MRRSRSRRAATAHIAAALIVSLAAGAFAFHFVEGRFEAGWSIADGPLMHQNLMHWINGDGLRSTLNSRDYHWPMTHYFKIHSRWMMYPLGLLYALRPRITTYLAVQTAALFLALFALVAASPDRNKGWAAALLVGTSAPFWGAAFAGAHAEVTAVTGFVLAALPVLIRWDERRETWWKLCVGAGLVYLFSLKEDIALLLLGWSLAGAVLDEERRRFYAILVTVSAAVAFVDFTAILTAGVDEPATHAAGRFGWLFGEGPTADFGGAHQWAWRRTYLVGVLAGAAGLLVFLRGLPARVWLPTLLVGFAVAAENTLASYLGHLYLIGHYQTMLVAALAVLLAVALHHAEGKRMALLIVAAAAGSAALWSASSLADWTFFERPVPVLAKSGLYPPRAVLDELEEKTPWNRGERYAVTADLMYISRPTHPVEALGALDEANRLPEHVLLNAKRGIRAAGPGSIPQGRLLHILDSEYHRPVEIMDGFLLFSRRGTTRDAG